MGNLQDRELIQGNENLKSMSREVSACMLEKSLYVGVGLGVGTALAISRRKTSYFFYGAGIGTCVDFLVAYNYDCKDVIQSFEKAKEATKLKLEQEKKTKESS
jgi:hypothetical protein